MAVKKDPRDDASQFACNSSSPRSASQGAEGRRKYVTPRCSIVRLDLAVRGNIGTKPDARGTETKA
jgi:hypothetical protein